MKRYLLAILGLVFLGIVAAGVLLAQNAGNSHPDVKERPKETAAPPAAKPSGLPVVATRSVEPGKISRTIDLTGSVVASRIARIASPGEGPVQDCRVFEGDYIRSGERVLSIGRNKAAAAQLMAAQAALREQEQDLRRTEQLVESGAIPGAQLDTARAKHQGAMAQLMKARESTEDYRVNAPWDGVVAKVLVKDGDYVAPRTPLVEIFDPKSLVVRFAVPEVQSTEIKAQMQVNIRLDAHPGHIFRGKVSRVYPELDTRMRTRTMEAVLTEPADLIPGMFGRIQVITKTIDHAVVLPTEAVIVTPKGECIAFVVKDGKAVRRKVRTGIEETGTVQIVEGISAGDEVVVSGNEKLKEGAEVQVRSGGAR